MSRLVTQDINCHYTAERVCKKMNTTVLSEAWVIGTPQSIDTVGFFDDGRRHFCAMLLREIVGNVEEHIAEYAPYVWYAMRSDVFQRKGVCSRIVCLFSIASIFKRERQSPVDLQQMSDDIRRQLL